MSQIRMGGIASGMNTETIVQQLVAARRTRVDDYERKVTKNEWKTQVYNEVNQSLANFILNSRKNLGLTDVDYFGNFKHKSIDKVNWVNKATSSDDKIFTAKAESNAIAGKYSVIVKSLAKTATVVGKSLNSSTPADAKIKFSGSKEMGNVANDKKLADLMASSTVISSGKFKVNVNGKEIELDASSSMTVQEALEKISTEADVKVSFDDTTKKIKFESKYEGKTRQVEVGGTIYTLENKISFGDDDATSVFFGRLGLIDLSERKFNENVSKVTSDTKLRDLSKSFVTDSEGNFTIELNGKKIELNESMTVNDAIYAIRNNTDININFDDGSKMLFMSTKNTGSKKIVDGVEVTNSIKFGSDDNTKKFFEKLGIVDQAEKIGEDSQISFNGSDFIKYSSNNISINGINLSLNNVSDKKNDGSFKEEYVTVSTDVDGIFEKVKGFVEEYNKIMDDLQSKLSEKVEKKYQPLTKTERGELKEEEVKLWDEKAKSGLLSDDKVIRNMISDIRSALYEQVNTTFDREGKNEKGTKIGFMFELGITTGTWKEGAKLKIDEAKLKKAIADDPNKVLDILFQTSDDKRVTIDSKDSRNTIKEKNEKIANKRAENGVFIRIMDSINNGMENIIKHAGTGKNPDLLTQVNSNILMSFRTTRSGLSDLGKDLRGINKFMDREIERLNAYEDRLWASFTAMEKAIARAQEQSGWITKQMGM